MPKVKFVEGGKAVAEVEVPQGTNLRRAAIDNGIPIHHDALMPSWLVQKLNCLGNSMCGTCYVYIKNGMENASRMGLVEKARLAAAVCSIGHEEECRLSCQTQVLGDMEVEIHPPLNLFGKRFWE